MKRYRACSRTGAGILTCSTQRFRNKARRVIFAIHQSGSSSRPCSIISQSSTYTPIPAPSGSSNISRPPAAVPAVSCSLRSAAMRSSARGIELGGTSTTCSQPTGGDPRGEMCNASLIETRFFSPSDTPRIPASPTGVFCIVSQTENDLRYAGYVLHVMTTRTPQAIVRCTHLGHKAECFLDGKRWEMHVVLGGVDDIAAVVLGHVF
ncbi:hypothetical protein EDB89DRAFT_841196 [Lactarius sanguifluus]|nr:hypothetical protein EDB89DRAFT_841196 [Lactarius sanguifluus]